MERYHTFDEHHVQGVYRYIYEQVGNREEAEDLTERAFMRAIQTPPPGDAEPSTGRQSTESLLWRAAYAVVSAYLGQCYARFLEPPDVAERGNAVERAERLLARLAPQERDALTYRLIGNCSLDETAARMGLSAQAALALQWRALTHATRLAEQDVTLGAYTPRATSDDAR